MRKSTRKKKTSDSEESKQEKKFWRAAVGTSVLSTAIAALFYRQGRGIGGKRKGFWGGTFVGTRKKFYALMAVLLACILITGVIAGIRLKQYFSEKDSELVIDLLANPGVEMDDGREVISADMDIQLFKVFYNGEGNAVTVASKNGDKVIAPGTGGVFTFRLKNTGNVDLYYALSLDPMISDNRLELPIQLRLKGAGGEYLIGGEDYWESAAAWGEAADTGSIRQGSNSAYTLEWRWPYEGGSDAADTYIGNHVLDQNFTYTLVIHTLAMLPSGEGGGFYARFERIFPFLLIILLILLFAAVLILGKYRRAEKRNRE